MTQISGLRTVTLDYMTRVEGEGGLRLELRDGKLQDVKLDIFEPPRFFESFLRGRSAKEVPDITARICGICPVAYQMSSVHALEAALGIVPGPEIRTLRRLLYCAEWIESHALHIYMLQAPDFFGFPSVIELAGAHPDLVKQALNLKKVGNELLVLLGGRSVHPISVRIGGFHRVPTKRELQAIRSKIEWALSFSLETCKFVSGLPLPDFTANYEFVALSHPREYALNEGHIVSATGLDISVKEYEQMFLEEHVPHSTALHSVRSEKGTSYLVGPLARLNLNRAHLSPLAQQAAADCGISWPSSNPYVGIIARAIELVHVCEEALQIIDNYTQPEPPYIEFKPQAGEGCAATEAPRGLLYHRYRINDQGLVQFAKIVPPTAQNYRRMEDDLRLLIPQILNQTDEEMVATCEKLIRNYDPCISCSTHFLKLERIEK